MDAKSVGETIRRLRIKNGLTQSELAKRLNVSVKTVSKWETGQGYPDIVQFPAMTSLFGVTVDYLMTGERKGIMVCGNLIVDTVKNVDTGPRKGMTNRIRSMTKAVGGCVASVIINLAKIDPNVPLYAFGRIGDDEYGRYLMKHLQKYRADTAGICVSNTSYTSFSDVMNSPQGERTIFHAKGASAEFCPEDVDVSSVNGSILHIGYLLLLDQFDAPDPEYGTVMARFLHDMQQRGIRTSFDVVSDISTSYRKKIIPELRYSNFAIMNETECCGIWGVPARHADGSIHLKNIRTCMERMVACGVKEKAIVHSREACFCLDAQTGEFTAVASLDIPAEEIRGNVGTGDAFCAGCLYGIYTGMSNRRILEFSSAAAACSLFDEDCVSGLRSKNEILKVEQAYKRQSIPLEEEQ